jgi:hypothetical protein
VLVGHPSLTDLFGLNRPFFPLIRKTVVHQLPRLGLPYRPLLYVPYEYANAVYHVRCLSYRATVTVQPPLPLPELG